MMVLDQATCHKITVEASKNNLTTPSALSDRITSESTFMADVFSTAANETCADCGNVGLSDGEDGFFYCIACGKQADHIVDAGIADDTTIYSARNTRRPCAPIKEKKRNDRLGPTDLRMSYVHGLQLMINYQCKALVEKFNVNPSICGISGLIWLRYLRFTRAFDDGWVDKVREQSPLEIQMCNKMFTTKTGGKQEPRKSYNQRMVLLCYKALRKLIPLSCSLAITYLSCHIAREPVLPTDIQRWTLEGKLPYLTAFIEIEKTITAEECPLSGSVMFRPSRVVPLLRLESLAANIAQSVGLTLPPVNFSAIASRYLKHLSLPVEKILPYACCIHDWSMPPGLWLSACQGRLPTRVCVMAVLIIAVRIMYNLNGFGKWEASLSVPIGSTCINKSSGGLDSPLESNTEAPQDPNEEKNCPSEVHKLEYEASRLLCELQMRSSDISEKLDYSKDLTSYLQYCKDVVFGGLPFESQSEANTEVPQVPDEDKNTKRPRIDIDNSKEKKMIKRLWDFYIKGEKDLEGQEEARTGTKQRRMEKVEVYTRPRKYSRRRHEEESVQSLDEIGAESSLSSEGRENSASNSLGQSSEAAEPPSTSNYKPTSDDSVDASAMLMKLHMEENRFYYIPPRKHVKRLDYLHYAWKRDDQATVHADYYILLHACAREAQVDIR